MSLLSNVTYLAACAEDVQFKHTATMTAISRRLSSDNYLSKLSSVLTAHDLITYLEKYRKEYYAKPEWYLAEGRQSQLFDLEICKAAISNSIERDPYIKSTLFALQTFAPGVKTIAEVVKKENMSFVCAISSGDNSVKGFISAFEFTKYGLSPEQYDLISEVEIIECEVIEYDYEHRSFQLRFLSKHIAGNQ